MKRIKVLLLNIMMVLVTYGQTDSDATAIAKLNLALSHIEMDADSIQVNGIIDMLITQKQKTEKAEKALSSLVKASSSYNNQKESLRIERLKYEYLINTVNERYAAIVGFHISDVSSFETLRTLSELIVSKRRLSILNKYKQLSLDYVNSKYKGLGD